MEKKEDIAAFKDYKDDGGAAPSPQKAAAPEEKPAPAPKPEKKEKEAPKKEETTSKPTSAPAPMKQQSSASKGDRVFASPFARKIAKEKNVDLSVRISFLPSAMENIHLILVRWRYRSQWSNHCSRCGKIHQRRWSESRCEKSQS